MSDPGNDTGDRIAFDTDASGIRRMRARFRGHAYDRHRHESYAIGITDAGTQCFHYRGALRASLPRQVLILHPDESHDGHAGADRGFQYRILYLDPALLREALGPGRALPFIPEAVAHDPIIEGVLDRAFADFPAPLDPLATDALIADLAEGLRRRCDDAPPSASRSVSQRRIAMVRDLFDDAPESAIESAELERLTGLTRFELARQFRNAYGTSPHRYLLGRRLEKVRNLILTGESLAHAAAASGFADQSHMTRHFRARYGMPPGRWVDLARD